MKTKILGQAALTGLLLFFGLSVCPVAYAVTYYVDYDSGSGGSGGCFISILNLSK